MTRTPLNTLVVYKVPNTLLDTVVQPNLTAKTLTANTLTAKLSMFSAPASLKSNCKRAPARSLRDQRAAGADARHEGRGGDPAALVPDLYLQSSQKLYCTPCI